MNVLIVDRELPFAELAARLSAEGWRRAEDPTAPPPIIAGEPEIADFERADLRLHYHFEPATGMRELRVSGPRGEDELAALASRLPTQGLERARELLRREDVESRLLALRMIEAMNDGVLLHEVAVATGDDNPTVSRQAAHTFVRLIAKPAAATLRTLGQWKEENPGKSVIFLLASSTKNKLQILRWLAHDRRESNEHIEAVLRTALEDPDWEVRVTAIVIASRLRATSLADDVARTRLPDDTADGINVDERRMLRTIQLYAVERLLGADVPPAADSPPNTKESMRAHLLRCLAGEPVSHQEKAFSFITSMTTPLPDAWPVPVPLPAGIVGTDRGYRLESSGIDLCWVPPIDHWLGDELPRMQISNPIRNARSAGFFIAREPLDSRPCSYDAAVEHCRILAARTGLHVRLPTADEWEMAARGIDGRRFPWGSNARSTERFGASPWGIIDAVGRVGEWTATTQGADAVVCGGEAQWVCAMRAAAARDSAHAVRFVIPSAT
jgi:sulfatase-modifying factor enzyme 1